MDYFLINYGLVFLGIIITLVAQIFVSSSYSKYKKVKNKNGLTGFEVAKKILDENGLQNIHIVEIKGNLTDHYDPSRKVVRLSTEIFNGTSIASTSVAAHECGHAIQDKDNYNFMRIRGKLVPIVNLSSKLGYLAVFIGIIFSLFDLAIFGIILLLAMLLFELITLPVEFDASNRAAKQIENLNLLEGKEKDQSKTMLRAAAFTYVAALVTTLLEILRLFLLATNRRD